MSRLWVSVLLLLLIFIPTKGQSSSQKTASLSKAQALIQKVIARYRAIFSLHMIYQRRDRIGEPRQFRSEFTMFGSSWRSHALRDDGRGGDEVTHKGKSLQHLFGPGGHWVRITLPKPPDQDFPAPPYYAGTFWFKEECKYIEKHAAEASLLGTSEFRGIAGMVLEWPISTEERWAALGHVDYSVKGGRLRLLVAPQLGYVLPCYEYYDTQGKLSERRWAKDFQEYAPGIYIPHHIAREYYQDNRLSGAIYFDIEAVDHVNEPIDEKAFILDLPEGTVVVDSRSQTHSVQFRLGVTPPGQGTEDLEEVIAHLPPPSQPGGSWYLAVLLGIVLGLSLLALLAFGYQYRRRGRQTSSAPPSRT
jgi:hypothetical protein